MAPDFHHGKNFHEKRPKKRGDGNAELPHLWGKTAAASALRASTRQKRQKSIRGDGTSPLCGSVAGIAGVPSAALCAAPPTPQLTLLRGPYCSLTALPSVGSAADGGATICNKLQHCKTPDSGPAWAKMNPSARCGRNGGKNLEIVGVGILLYSFWKGV